MTYLCIFCFIQVNGKYDYGNNADRVINVCISGRQTTFNIWGDLHDGDFIGLKVEKREVKGEDFSLDVHAPMSRMKERTSVSCYQFVPYITPHTHRWRADEANPRLKSPTTYIELGRVFRTARGKTAQYTQKEAHKMCSDLSHMVTHSSLFEIHWNICCY